MRNFLHASARAKFRSSTSLIVAGVAATASLLCIRAASADEVVFHGNRLSGSLEAVTATGIQFKVESVSEDTPITGTITVPFQYIEKLTTEAPVHLLHGDEDETVGRVFGVRDGAILIGDSEAAAASVPTASIHSAMASKTYEGSALSRARSQFRAWKAHVDLGAALTQGTTDSSSISAGIGALRTGEKTRLRLESAYRYAKQKEKGSPSSTTANEVGALARLDYDLTPRLFTFGSFDLKHDEIEDLKIRTIPKVGLGYFLYRSKSASFAVDGGVAYVYESYDGGDTNQSVNLALGKEWLAPLALGATFRWRTDYLPAFDAFLDDFLVRSEFALLFPLNDFLGFKLSIADEYDSTPSTGTDKNKLVSTVGASLTF